jgi:hypothetical protein
VRADEKVASTPTGTNVACPRCKPRRVRGRFTITRCSGVLPCRPRATAAIADTHGARRNGVSAALKFSEDGVGIKGDARYHVAVESARGAEARRSRRGAFCQWHGVGPGAIVAPRYRRRWLDLRSRLRCACVAQAVLIAAGTRASLHTLSLTGFQSRRCRQ